MKRTRTFDTSRRPIGRRTTRSCVAMFGVLFGVTSVQAQVQFEIQDDRSETLKVEDILKAWGSCAGCPADLNRDGQVDVQDLMLKLASDVEQIDPIRTFCDQEPAVGTPIFRGAAAQGGGMTGVGWDGPGQNAATIYWYVEDITPDFDDDQRAALITAMQAWAGVVQITFREVAKPNLNVAIDWDFLTGDHSATEPAESGDPDCPFSGAGGALAHAGFPPGVASQCVNPMTETWSGNVHFDEDETWELDNANGAGEWSLTFIACHEMGHSIGLIHSPGSTDVMRASGSSGTLTFVGLSADDISNIQGGYAAGAGSVVTLNNSGIWVDGGFAGLERGNTSGNPVNTIIEGVNGVPPFTNNIVIHIDAGNYPESLLITEDVELRAENGTVTIGN
ncbi:MAG: matrixin family metalloprotease [Planctomycetota bacterium]|nr:matrixin family metalloprotease [Planctomycetota bacterium]